MTPEFSHIVRLDSLGGAPRTITLAASVEERAALARRFGLAAIDRLEAEATLHRDGDMIMARGQLQAEVTQLCAATGDPLPARIDEPFALRFVPEDRDPGEEVELSEKDCDTLPHDGAAIDLGEAVAETMALALDPFPRAPGADAALRAAGVLEEGEAGPFAALKALRDKLSG